MSVDVRRRNLVARKEQALSDLAELEAQLAAGEIDGKAAADLRGRYSAEAIEAIEALDAAEDTTATPATTGRRAWIAVVGFTVVVGVAFAALMGAVEPRPPGGFITGGVAADAVREGGVDLSRITNEELEAVVAANPEVVPMRLALARRYVEAGDFSAALPHYFEILDRRPNEPEALMYLGWMTYVSGDAATGAALLERSLGVDPENPLAMWFLANARFHGLDDPHSAIPLLEAVLASGVAPPHVVETAEEMLDSARGDGP